MSFLGFGHQRERNCHDDEKHIHFFKMCVEEVKSQYPHLNNYALHQKAKELFAKEIGRELLATKKNRRHSEKSNIINNVFSKLRFGKPKKDVGSDEETSNYEYSTKISGDAEGEANSRARRSIAPRKSVALPAELEVDRADINMLRNLYGDFDDSDQSFNASISSLARSLDGIEQSWNLGGGSRRHSAGSAGSRRYSAGSVGSRNVDKRASRRVSGASIDLTGVKEEGDNEHEFTDMVVDALSDKRFSFSAGDSNNAILSSESSLQSKSLKKAVSVSEFLPDEIKLMVTSVSDKVAMMQKADESSTEEKGNEFSDSVSLRASDVFRGSGILTRSLSSENFEGDFSAWRDSFRFQCQGAEKNTRKNSLEGKVNEESSGDSNEVTADEKKESSISSETSNKNSKDKPVEEKRAFFGWGAFIRPGRAKNDEKIQKISECNNIENEKTNDEGIDLDHINDTSCLISTEEKVIIAKNHRRGITHDSLESSMSSTDSKNFTGDFSAWRDSFKKLPKMIDEGPSSVEEGEDNEESRDQVKLNGRDIVNMHQSNSSCLTIDEEDFSGDPLFSDR
ncbi:hypothetical protein ACHAXS_010383 [Conticribra weissflogii]